MGMGYGANYADTISKEDIIKICGDVATDFFNWFDDKPQGLLDHFATMIFCEYDDLGNFESEEEFKRVETMYDCLTEDFLSRAGIELALQYHSIDEGDRYDEISESYFAVYGMYKLTDNAERLLDRGIKLDRKFYVTFG